MNDELDSYQPAADRQDMSGEQSTSNEVDPGKRTKHSWPFRPLMATALIAALVGSGTTMTVAHETGWGSQAIIQRVVATNASTIADSSTNVQSVFSAVLPSVVSITAKSEQASPFFGRSNNGSSEVTAEGTGVIVSADGEVLTNNHVIDGATSVSVTLNGSTDVHTASVVQTSSNNDLALIKINGVSGLTPATFGDSTKMVVGDNVVAVGYALGLSGGPSVTDGIISATGRSVESETTSGSTETLSNMLQTDAAISSGNSGGPLVNAGGPGDRHQHHGGCFLG